MGVISAGLLLMLWRQTTVNPYGTAACLSSVLAHSMQRGVIVHEEKLLAELFGEDYHAYCRHVRRWL